MYNTFPLDEDVVDQALDIFESFISVNKGRETMAEKVSALQSHCESLGFTGDTYTHLVASIIDRFGDGRAPLLTTGVLLGLRIAEVALEKVDVTLD